LNNDAVTEDIHVAAVSRIPAQCHLVPGATLARACTEFDVSTTRIADLSPEGSIESTRAAVAATAGSTARIGVNPDRVPRTFGTLTLSSAAHGYIRKSAESEPNIFSLCPPCLRGKDDMT
jgi:hypothetical protein